MKNADFEGQKTKDTLWWGGDGGPYTTEFGEIDAPEGWTVWWVENASCSENPDFATGRPEAKVISLSEGFPDGARIQSGDKAAKLFTFWRCHEMGLLQQVEVEPGLYRASMLAHAWYTRCSDKPHAGPLDHDCQTNLLDAHCFLSVGIDPTGGIDPRASTVVWGDWAEEYGQYGERTYSHAVEAGGTITVFLRSLAGMPLKHNDVYIDNVHLDWLLRDYEPEGREYQSTMFVLPQDASRERLGEIMDEAYPDRRTLGFSADDAGVLGHAVLYDIPEAEQDDYRQFYQQFYPGCAIEFAGQSGNWEEYLLWQREPEWCDEEFGGTACPYTIGQKGCFITNIAVAQRLYSLDPWATPVTVDEELGPDGYDGCDTRHSAAAERCGIAISRTGDLDGHLANGGVAMVEVQPTNLLHFVLAIEKQGDDYLVLDPYHGEVALLSDRYQGLESFRILRVAEEPEPPALSAPLITLHLQTNVPGAVEYVRRVKPGAVKIFHAEDAQQFKAVSPETLTVLRYHTGNQDLGGNLAQAARDYVDSFRDTVSANAESIDYVESWNETIPSADPDAIKRAVEFDRHFAGAFAATGLPVAPVLLNVAVGNPLESEVDLLIPAVREAIRYGGAVGYHAYWASCLDECYLESDWQYHAGRWQQWDLVFREHRLAPDYIFTEAGPIGTPGRRADGYIPLLPADGWRSDNCLGGDVGRLVRECRRFEARCQAWNAQRGNRCLGACLFTSGIGCGWESFQITESEMQKL